MRIKQKHLPLVKRFYNLGFNIVATEMTAEYLKERGIRTRVYGKICEGNDEILRDIRSGKINYIVNTRAILSGRHYEDGYIIRRCAVENNATMFTSLDTVRMLLEVLEEMTIGISTIDAQ